LVDLYLRESATLVATDLVQMMNVVADTLSEPGDLAQTLTRITCTACEMVPRADYVSISVLHPDGTLETLAPTDPLIVTVDELQQSLGQGLCYSVGQPERVTYTGNVALDPRWAVYGAQVARWGIASQLSFTLHRGPAGETRLNIFSRKRAAFGDSRRIAEIFVSHAKVALGYAREVNTLRAAVATRTVIGEAIGIVMSTNGLNEERAFEFLIRVSQNNNVKLRIVAAEIVETRAQSA
jgi:ANTAR domain-containing protein